MTDTDLAKAVIKHRHQTSLFVGSNLQQELGSEGFKEAVSRAWVQPCVETGFLRITDNMGTLREIERLAHGARS